MHHSGAETDAQCFKTVWLLGVAFSYPGGSVVSEWMCQLYAAGAAGACGVAAGQ